MFNILVADEGLKFDFMIRKESAYHIAELNRRQRKALSGFEAWFVSPEDLVIAKLLWIQLLESTMQKDDIIRLLKVKNLDVDYIKEWCNQLNLKTYSLL